MPAARNSRPLAGVAGVLVVRAGRLADAVPGSTSSSTEPRIDEIVKQVAGLADDIQRPGDDDELGSGMCADGAAHAIAYAARYLGGGGGQCCSDDLGEIDRRHGAWTVRGATHDQVLRTNP